jgi:hypothetical protein
MSNIDKDLKHLNLSKDILYKVDNMYKLITLRTGKIYRANLRRCILYACLNLTYIKEGIFQELDISNGDLSNGLKIVKLYIPEYRMVHETVEYYLFLFSKKLNLQHNAEEFVNIYAKDKKDGNKKQIALDIIYKWLNTKIRIPKNELYHTIGI